MNKTILKNILAVVIGFFSVFILSIGTDVLMSFIGIFPDMRSPELFTDIMYAWSLFYSCIYTTFGGYLTAKFSATKPLRQVYILAILGFISSSTGAYINWAIAAGHEWFCIAMIITGPIFVILGGKIYLKNK